MTAETGTLARNIGSTFKKVSGWYIAFGVVVALGGIAGGSAIQEINFPGSPKEMVSMYHDRDGRLSMTHYCMMGNQPRLDLESSEKGKLSFAFSEANDLDPSTGMHMHSLVLSFVDETNITQRWTVFQDGEALASQDMHLTRIQ